MSLNTEYCFIREHLLKACESLFQEQVSLPGGDSLLLPGVKSKNILVRAMFHPRMSHYLTYNWSNSYFGTSKENLERGCVTRGPWEGILSSGQVLLIEGAYYPRYSLKAQKHIKERAGIAPPRRFGQANW